MNGLKARMKLTIFVTLIFVLVLGTTSLVLADFVVNNIDNTIDGTYETKTITSGGSTVVGFYVQPNNSDPTDVNGCNATGSTPATVTLNVPQGVSASSTILTFTGCGVVQYVTFSSLVPGTYSITVSGVTGGKDGSAWQTTEASFQLIVSAPPDSTPPVIQPNVTGTLGSNGWYTSNVTVSWTVSDPESTVTSTNGCGSTTVSNETNGTTLTCSATSSGGTNSQSVTVKVDKTGPSATLAVTEGTLGANGWYISDVKISTSGSDSISGPVSCTADQYQTTDSAGATFNGSCTNAAGLTTSASPITLKVDKSGPSANLTVTGGTTGANGWYTSDITVSTTGSDISPVTCSAEQYQTSETAGTAFNGSCTNEAGLITNAAPLIVKLDKTGPTAALAVTAGTLGANSWYTSDVTVATSGNDDISSPVSCTPNQTLTTDTAGTVVNGSCTNDAGLSTSAAPISVKLDKTSPSANLAIIAGTLGANGWYTSDVTVSTSGSDDISGPVTCTGNQFQTSETNGTIFNGTCSNNAGLVTAAAPLTVKLDKTAPTASLAVTDGTLGANGWYTSDVTISASGSDDISGPVSCTDDQTLATETAGAVFSGSCTNDAGLTGVAAPLTVKLDKTGPSAALAVIAGTLGTNGWYTSDVTVSTSGSDDISGPVVCTADQYQTSETSGNVFNGACTNNAGLSTNAVAFNVKLDKTGPSATLAVTVGTLGANGWYTSDVTVTTTGSDTVSSPVKCTIVQYQTIETTGTTFNGLCTNDAGLSTLATPLTVKLDKTAPTNIAFVGGPADGGTYYFGFVPGAPTCTADDAVSGLASCLISGYSNAIGTHTLTATATDNAGLTASATRSYEVKAWKLYGFYQPVDMNNVYNTVKNGSTVPLKFEIFAGPTELTDTGFVKSLTYAQTSCDLNAITDDIETTATGNTVLRYDTVGGQFIYNWKTPATAGKCYRVTMTTQDGSFLQAFFKLK